MTGFNPDFTKEEMQNKHMKKLGSFLIGKGRIKPQRDITIISVGTIMTKQNPENAKYSKDKDNTYSEYLPLLVGRQMVPLTCMCECFRSLINNSKN